MIYNNLESGEVISILSLGVICAVIFLISGIVILITKNTALISKDTKYKEPNLFTKIYGWVTIVFSSLMIAIMILTVFLSGYELMMVMLLGVVAITMILIQVLLQKKFRVKK